MNITSSARTMPRDKLRLVASSATPRTYIWPNMFIVGESTQPITTSLGLPQDTLIQLYSMTQQLKASEIPGIIWSSACRLLGFTSSKLTMIPMSQAHRLLEEDYQTIESGYGISSDALLCVAACVYMPSVTPEMIEWWFGWIRNTEQYKLWHPRDHIWSDWEGPPGEYVGGHHLVEEFVGGEKSKLRISFEDPKKYFGPDWRRGFEETGYGAAICGRVAVWDERKKGYLKTGHMLHLIKREPDGCRMRSRFWLGDVEGVPIRVGNFLPKYLGAGLMKHCIEEMAILASILPGLYAKETEKKAKL